MNQINHLLDKAGSTVDSEKYELLREMSHRVNNEYALVVSAVSLRALKSGSTEVKTALTDISNLLMRFADVHRALMFPGVDGPVEVCVYLRQLCRVISGARLRDRNIRLLLVESEPQFLSAERGWKLGLVVSELITNSAKHAFGGGGGIIRVELAKDDDFVLCRILDNGRKRNAVAPGQGLRLVHSLVQSAGGSLDYDFNGSGRMVTVSMPGFETMQGPIQKIGETKNAAAV